MAQKVTPTDLRIDVSGSILFEGLLEIAASVFLPDKQQLNDPPVVVFAVPGGGYSRGYFDLHFPGQDAYSQAEHHVNQGMIFVSCDHIGVGESSIPGLGSITFEMIAAAYNAAVRNILERLQKGTLADHFPAVSGITSIGIGQSMGGCITIVTQGIHATFDAIAPLGFSAIHTVLPHPAEAQRQDAISRRAYGRDADLKKLSLDETSGPLSEYLYAFHWEDVPEDILNADMEGGYPIRRIAPPWGSMTIPNCAITMMSPGCVTQEAAAITVPVLIGVGERDVCPDPHKEPEAYQRSMDISLYIVPQMAHMHNFASTRKLLWERIVDWARTIAGQMQRPT